jgi:hypothetical protein
VKRSLSLMLVTGELVQFPGKLSAGFPIGRSRVVEEE